MMKDTRLLIRLKEYVNYASTAESNLAHYITEDPQAVIGKSIHELARLTYTSPSTIVRFCRKMGFQGYREFQQGLMYETALYHESRDVALQDITPKDSTRNVIRKVTSKNVESLRITEKLLDPKVVDACVELLTQCRLVALFGLGASLLAAQDLQLKLLRVDKLCYLAEDWHSQLLYARNLHPDDLAIAFSYSGMTKETIACAKVAKQQGARVITVTRGECSTDLVKYADYALPVGSTEMILRSGAMSSRISQLNIIDILYTAYINRNYDACVKKFADNYIDIAQDVIRADAFRRQNKTSYPPRNNVARSVGTVTIDNVDYGRYMGELQIDLCPLPADPRVNVVAQVCEPDLALLPYAADPAYQFEFCE